MFNGLEARESVKFDYENARFSLRLRVGCERAVKAVWIGVDLGVWRGRGVAASVAHCFAMGDMGLILCNAKIRGRLDELDGKDASDMVFFLQKMNVCLTALIDAKLSETTETEQFDRMVWLTKADSMLDEVEAFLAEARDKKEQLGENLAKSKH